MVLTKFRTRLKASPWGRRVIKLGLGYVVFELALLVAALVYVLL